MTPRTGYRFTEVINETDKVKAAENGVIDMTPSMVSSIYDDSQFKFFDPKTTIGNRKNKITKYANSSLYNLFECIESKGIKGYENCGNKIYPVDVYVTIDLYLRMISKNIGITDNNVDSVSIISSIENIDSFIHNNNNNHFLSLNDDENYSNSKFFIQLFSMISVIENNDKLSKIINRLKNNIDIILPEVQTFLEEIVMSSIISFEEYGCPIEYNMDENDNRFLVRIDSVDNIIITANYLYEMFEE